MPDGTHTKPTYYRRLARFYLTPSMFFVPKMLYLLLFGYFALFYIGNVWVAVKFVFFTLKNSASLLGIQYVLWGSVFLVGLLAPFFASVYTITILYTIWESDRSRYQKILSSILVTIGTLVLIVVLDGAIRVVAGQLIFSDFVVLNHLSVRGL